MIRSQNTVGGWPTLAVNTQVFADPANPNAIASGQTFRTNREVTLEQLAIALEIPPEQISLTATSPLLVFSSPISLLIIDQTLLILPPSQMLFTAPSALLTVEGALYDYYCVALDMNTAYMLALNDRYAIANPDLAPLLARYLQEHTNNDSTRAYRKLLRICQGLELPTA